MNKEKKDPPPLQVLNYLVSKYDIKIIDNIKNEKSEEEEYINEPILYGSMWIIKCFFVDNIYFMFNKIENEELKKRSVEIYSRFKIKYGYSDKICNKELNEICEEIEKNIKNIDINKYDEIEDKEINNLIGNNNPFGFNLNYSIGYSDNKNSINNVKKYIEEISKKDIDNKDKDFLLYLKESLFSTITDISLYILENTKIK